MHGGKRDGAGRPAGAPNESTKAVRAAIARFAEENVDKLAQWIGEVNDPYKRAELFLKALEYHIPKLAREEQTGADGGPVAHTYRWLDGDDEEVATPPDTA